MGIGVLRVAAELLGAIAPVLPSAVKIVGSGECDGGAVALRIAGEQIQDGASYKIIVHVTPLSSTFTLSTPEGG